MFLEHQTSRMRTCPRCLSPLPTKREIPSVTCSIGCRKGASSAEVLLHLSWSEGGGSAERFKEAVARLTGRDSRAVEVRAARLVACAGRRLRTLYPPAEGALRGVNLDLTTRMESRRGEG